jgi:hypothetical protein
VTAIALAERTAEAFRSEQPDCLSAASVSRLRPVHLAPPCSCGWPVAQCERESQADGDSSAHDRRITCEGCELVATEPVNTKGDLLNRRGLCAACASCEYCDRPVCEDGERCEQCADEVSASKERDRRETAYEDYCDRKGDEQREERQGARQ